MTQAISRAQADLLKLEEDILQLIYEFEEKHPDKLVSLNHEATSTSTWVGTLYGHRIKAYASVKQL